MLKLILLALMFAVTSASAADPPADEPVAPAADDIPAEAEEAVDLVSATKEKLWNMVVTYSLDVVVVLCVMLVAWVFSGWVAGFARKGLERIRFDETLTKFTARLVRWLIMLLVILSCLSRFGVQTTSFAAMLGAAGLAIGLAFQGTLSNFAAGGMLLIFRPYKVGDVIKVADVTGTVNEIAMFTTELDSFDGRRFIIPNSQIFGDVIENITYHPRRRVDIDVGTAYAADIDQTREVLQRAIESVSEAESYPEPAVVLSGLGASSVDWSVRAWARREDFLGVKQSLVRAIKVELDSAGIEIPYPQMDVHMAGGDGPGVASASD